MSIGIHYTHDEFGGRAKYSGFDAIDDGRQGKDCNGHGTHVAALAGGSTYGVARDATLYSVRVYNCKGKGEASTITEAVNYAASQIAKGRRRGIINMSLVVHTSRTMNEAVRSAVASGIPVVAAAGNFHTNACKFSPSSVPGAITVAATKLTDWRALFSNYGRCVDIFAPGERIKSASHSCNSCTDTRDGTSMAAPIVTGVVAAILEARPTMSVTELTQYLIDTSTKRILSNVEGSPNRFLFAASI